MYGSQLDKIITSDLILRRQFCGIFAVDKLVNKVLKNNCGYIINTAKSTDSEGGEHWLLVYVKKGEVKFFDSYGKDYTEYGEQIKKWVLSANYPIENNIKVIQSTRSINCGLFVLFAFYFLVRGFSLKQIANKFSSNLEYNDKIVESFAWNYFHFNAKTEFARSSEKELNERILADLFLIYSNDYI